MQTFILRTKDPEKEPLEGMFFTNGKVALSNGLFGSSMIELKEWMKKQEPQYMMETEVPDEEAKSPAAVVG